MERAELATFAEELVEAYRSVLLIDPFIKLTVDLNSEGDFISSCIKDKAPLTWILRLNPNRHDSIEDIQYSVVQALLEVMFSDFSFITESPSVLEEVRSRIIGRLSTAISSLNIFSLEDNNTGESYEEG